mgnify:CR=1 FL=1
MKNKTLQYVEWIKTKQCLICYKDNPDPHHLQAIGMGGNRKKPTPRHYSCIPLCRLHHSEFHSKGKTDFEDKYIIDCWKEAWRLLREWICVKLFNY